MKPLFERMAEMLESIEWVNAPPELEANSDDHFCPACQAPEFGGINPHAHELDCPLGMLLDEYRQHKEQSTACAPQDLYDGPMGIFEGYGEEEEKPQKEEDLDAVTALRMIILADDRRLGRKAVNTAYAKAREVLHRIDKGGN